MQISKVIQDRIIVKPIDQSDTSKGGIVLPAGYKSRAIKGEVVEVGDGLWQNGHRCPPDVQAGDIIYYDQNAGTAIMIDGDLFFGMREANVLMVVSE